MLRGELGNRKANVHLYTTHSGDVPKAKPFCCQGKLNHVTIEIVLKKSKSGDSSHIHTPSHPVTFARSSPMEHAITTPTASYTYTTNQGEITVYPSCYPPEETQGLGFILETRTTNGDITTTTPTQNRLISLATFYPLWKFIGTPLTTIGRKYLCGIASDNDDDSTIPLPTIRKIIPDELRHHLIIVTPPSSSNVIRNFPPPCNLQSPPKEISRYTTYMRQTHIPEIRIPEYPEHLAGEEKVYPGKVIIIGGRAYYVWKLIGRMSEEGAADAIAMEGLTMDATSVLLVIPPIYVQGEQS